jgi:hypothetical protein
MQSSSGGNIAMGMQSMQGSSTPANNTGHDNIGLGYSSLFGLSSGNYNIAIGYQALDITTSGSNNIAIGQQALQNLTTGIENFGIGTFALQSTTTGFGLTAMGEQSLHNITTGSDDVAFGKFTGTGVITGTNNTFIGSNADTTTSTASYMTAIGASSSVTTANTVVLGRTTDHVVIGATGTNGGGYALQVTGTAGLSTSTAWTNFSDRRLKDVHGDYEYGLEEILKLHTVRFNYKKNNALKMPSDVPMIGFIAQEVKDVIPDAVHKASNGYYELNVDPIHWAVVNAIKELAAKVTSLFSHSEEQTRKIASLEAENKQLKTDVEELKKSVNELKKDRGK